MGTQFKDQSWGARYQKLGDEAEGIFELSHKRYDRYGWNRPDVNMGKMPKHVCYMPDYVMDVKGFPVLVEVQGCGRDQLFKFKLDKLEALSRWQEFTEMPCYYWLWDGKHKRSFLVPLKEFNNFEGGTLGEFPEGKAYISFSVETFLHWIEDYEGGET